MVIKRPDANADIVLPTWLDTEGIPLGCLEKIKMLNENIVEIHDMCQEALEDAVLMGCDEKQIRDALLNLVERLQKPFKSGV